jgi:PST family polysaccharide transporter
MLTRHAALGASRMLAASLLGRMAALVAQVVTGFLLVDEDFGIYAAAIGVQSIAGLLRGGDVQSYLVTLPPSRRRRRTGTVFWISMVLYVLGLIPMLLAAPGLAAWFEDDRIILLLWILGVTMCLSPLRYVLRARINARLDFGANATATIVNNFSTYPLTILLAVLWREPVALAMPVLLGSMAEIVYLWRVAKPDRTDFIPHRRFVIPVLIQTRWLLAVSAMMSLWNSGDYFIAEFLVPTAVLGIYYFGYQLAVQPGRLFSTTVVNVLVPVVRRVIHDPPRLRLAIRRMIGTGGFAIGVVNISMVAGIESLERLVWAGRWTEATLSVQVLSIGLTYTAILGIATAPFMAERRYGETLVCNAIRAIGIVGGAAAGSLLWGTVNGIAIWVSGSMMVSSMIAIAWVVGRHGVPRITTLFAMIRCTTPVVVAGIAAAAIGHLTLESLGTGRLAAIPAGLLAGSSYLLATGLALVVIPADTRRQVLDLAPARIRRYLLASLGGSSAQDA